MRTFTIKILAKHELGIVRGYNFVEDHIKTYTGVTGRIVSTFR